MTLAEAPARESTAIAMERVGVRGKFFAVAEQVFHVRGVTYGTFATDGDGREQLDEAVVDHDFGMMAAANINTVRVYTVPPLWLLDTAANHGLRVIVGVPWEQHVAFLGSRRQQRAIIDRVRTAVRELAGHPAILAYAVGNEIPAPVVRWHGKRRVERFIRRLYDAAKAEDPATPVTYVNYPSTEYLELPFLDVVSFNVYLETEEKLGAYLARLHNLAGDRPVLMAEIGLDSRRNGPDAQRATLEWQIRAIFADGCAGAVVFAWTDEWHRGGHAIDDWDFGLTTRDRSAKPALKAASDAFADVPFPAATCWPRMSVVVCSYNGARTIRDTLDALMDVDYPDLEVIVIDDGSTDATAAIANEYAGVSVFSTENRGLSNARNLGMRAASGEIVAYTDDDAYPDPHWLKYLAWTFMHTTHAGVGGPNIPPPGDGPIAECVANAPGGPVQVLLSDTVAEHIPGCNMAFRREKLLAIGGFDPRYRTAGDDVDVCWRLQEQGWTLGFHPSAVVWHHRRNSVRTYWKQQQGYGRAEALLEGKWPERYNSAGHVTWAGRLYGRGLTEALRTRAGHVYSGLGGAGLFQSLYAPAPGLVASLPLMPEWYFLVAILAGLSILGAVSWTPLLLATPLFAALLAAPIGQAVLSAKRASFPDAPGGHHVRRRLLTGVLHLVQPIARLRGRIRHGLTPWRRRGAGGFALPRPREATVWTEQWRSPEEHAHVLRQRMADNGVPAGYGDGRTSWDIGVHGGLLGSARVRTLAEEHGAGRQLVRVRWWPRWSPVTAAVVVLLAALGALAAIDGAVVAAAALGMGTLSVMAGAVADAGRACAAVRDTVAALAYGDAA